MARPLDTVLKRLENVQERNGAWLASCPAHEDKSPSLSISEGDDGRVLLHCHGGCPKQVVLDAAGLSWPDLYPSTNGSRNARKKSGGKPTAAWQIKDAAGVVQAEHVRFDRDDGGKKCLWRLPGGTFKEGLKGRKLPTLPLYRSEHAKNFPEDVPVVVVEGEKAADALSEVYPAVLATVTGAEKTPGRDALEVLRGRPVLLWCDNDVPGRTHMRGIAAALQGISSEVRLYEWTDAPEKGDAADHPAVKSRSRKTVEGLIKEMSAAPVWRPGKTTEATRENNTLTFTAADLMAQEPPPVRWAVPGLVPEGVTLLAGKAKMGKSWLTLGLCIATAVGGVALGKVPVERGEVLYLALEDNPRRLYSRLGKLLKGGAPPQGLHLATEWPTIDMGGVEALEGFIQDHPDTALVVVDTLKKIRPRASGNRSVYDTDYEALEPLLPLAAEHRIAVVVNHHLRKMDADDPLDAISGSTGLSGGVDGALVLKRERGRADAFLYVTGREIEEERELALKWDANLASWAIVGDAAEYKLSEERARIVRVLEETGQPMTPTEVADALGEKFNNVKQRLWQMSKDGQLDNNGGRYSVNTHNLDNRVTEEDPDGYSVTPVIGYGGRECPHDTVPGVCSYCRERYPELYDVDVSGVR